MHEKSCVIPILNAHTDISRGARDLKYCQSLHLKPYLCMQTAKQGFSYLSEVEARGLLNLGEKVFGPSKLGKLNAA